MEDSSRILLLSIVSISQAGRNSLRYSRKEDSGPLGLFSLLFPLAAAESGHLNPRVWELVSGRPLGHEAHKDHTHTAAALAKQSGGNLGAEPNPTLPPVAPPPRELGHPCAQTTNGPEPGLRAPREQSEGNRTCRFIDCGWSGRQLTQSQLCLPKSASVRAGLLCLPKEPQFPHFFKWTPLGR